MPEYLDLFTDGLSWPSISFAILAASLLLSVIILWRRYRSRRVLMQRVAELEALSAAGRAIVAAELDITALCELIAQEAGQVIDNSTFQVGLFENDCYTILFWTINGRKQTTPCTFDLLHNPGMVGWIRDSKHPLLIRDFQKELNTLPSKPRYVSDTPPRSAIFIPLVSGEEVTGIIAAQSNQPNRFNEDDLRRLMILANQAAAAIAHAQLFEQERRRAVHLELVGKIARQINAIHSQAEIFDHVVQLIREMFGFHPVSIFNIDPQTGDAVLQASSIPELVPQNVRLKEGQGIVGTAVSTQKMIVSNNTAEDERFIAQLDTVPIDIAISTRAEMTIPLIVNDEVLGALDVQSPQPGVFTAAERTALQALADEVAIAIDKARQLTRQRERAWVTTAQLQVAEAIGRSPDLEAVVNSITRLTPMLVGVSGCGILLWDENRAVYRGTAIFGPDQDVVETFTQLHLAIGDWPPLDAVHVGQEMFTTQKQPPWTPTRNKSQTTTSLTLLPISTNEQTMGVMVVSKLEPAGDDQTNPSLRRRQELLHNIVGQTAQAIESAYLRVAQQEEAWVNTVLLQVAEAVNSLIDLNEILNTIVRLVPMLVGVESSLILIWDEERQTYQAGPSHGLSKMGQGLLETEEIDPGEFLPVRTQPTEFLTPTTTYYSLRLPPWLAKILGAPTAEAFSLNARGHLVGTMLVGTLSQSQNGRSFSPRRLNILNGIAHQAATAVVNNQLYKESAERSRLEQEINVARDIQASLIPDGNPDIPGCNVASFWQAARQVSGDFYDFIPLPDGKWGIVIADVADKGIPAALFMALSRTILRTVALSRQDPGQALMRANQIIDNDTQSDLFVTIFYAIWDPDTYTLFYANGGHNPPLLLHNNGQSRLLKGNGMALGVLPDIEIESKIIRIHPGDTLIFYTDGVTEAMNEDYDEFGMARLRITADSAKNSNAHHIVEAITTAIHDHAGGTPQFDDVTLVVMKYQEDEA